MRGLSPIVAVVLLILIAIGAAVLVYLWMNRFVAATPIAEPVIKEKFQVESVDYGMVNTTHWYVTVWVRNVGQVPINITTAYLVDYATERTVCYNDTLSVQLEPNMAKAVNGAIVCDQIEETKTYILRIVTERGTEATYIFTVH